ncbi:MAG: hypothetical protein WCO60_17950 [Verrucomicrobiota bacterium]
MKTESSTSELSRREAFVRAITVALGLSTTVPSNAALPAKREPDHSSSEFVPENDYPFFGGEPSI